MTKEYPSKTVYLRLLKYLRYFKTAFILAIIGNVLYGAINALLVKFIKPLLDNGFVDQDPWLITMLPYFIVMVFLARGVANFMSTFFMGSVGRHIVMSFRKELFEKYLVLPSRYFNSKDTGTLISKITYNAEQVAAAATEALTIVLRESVLAVGLLINMLTISPRLTVMFIVVVPLIASIMHILSRRLRRISHEVQNSMGSVTHIAEEVTRSHQVIKIFGGQEYERARFLKAIQNNRRQAMKEISATSIGVPVVQLVAGVALAWVIYMATNSWKADITPGAFTSMAASLWMILQPIKQLTKINGVIQKGIAGAASIFATLDSAAEGMGGSHKLERANGALSLQKVSFGYISGKPVLEDINLEIEAGRTIALVGPSGSGKSTLVHLLPRFYDQTAGLIELDGVSIKEFELNNLRSHFALVSQNVMLFNDTIRANIAYGRDDVTEEQIIEAAKQASAYEFIQDLPEGFDTLVGDNGVRLSGGQRQRIAIARAIIKDAPILIFDEATSALDSNAEHEIQLAMEKLRASRTTIVIAHRLSTVVDADKIVVINKGRVEAQGNHSALMQCSSTYQKLYEQQFAA